MTNRRALWLSASHALWGVAIAISLHDWLRRPAPPGQLPGLASAIGIDAHAPMRFILGLIVIPILTTIALRPLTRLQWRTGNPACPWAFNGAAWTPVVALWFALITKSPLWVVVPAALAIAACVLLRDRQMNFSRDDVILIPTIAAVWMAIMDIAPDLPLHEALIVAAMLVLAVRLCVAAAALIRRGAAGGRGLPPLHFVFAPLALLFQTSFFPYPIRHFGWLPLLVALGTPFLPRLDRRRALRLLAIVIYPIALYSYGNATSLPTAEGKPRINFFEDGHFLLPASEMLDGERAYRDTIPGHGLLEDGFFDYLTMRVGGANAGVALRARAIVGGLAGVAVYALGATVTGSAAGGVLAYFLGALFGAAGISLRVVPALFSLAMIAHAVRRRSPQWLGYAARGVVVAAIMSLDFAAFTFVALLVATLRFRPIRAALRQMLIGLAAAGIPLFILLAILGIAGSFVRVTLVDVLTLGPVYAMDTFNATPALKQNVPEVLAAVFDKPSSLYVLWIGAVVIVALAMSRRASRRYEPLAIVAVWIAIAGVSYAERHHLHFQFAMSALLIGVGWRLARRLRPAYALILLMIGGVTTHLGVVSWMRHSHGPIDADLTSVLDLPRARGTLMTQRDAATLASARSYMARLGEGQTFFDFTNRGILYFLLERDCPIRQYEVAFFEREDLQREVIARLERDPRVVAALVPASPNADTVDGVPNAVRAPLVWAYLQTHFVPEFAEGDVVFWRRR